MLLGAVCNDMITKLVKLDEDEHTVKTSTKCDETSIYISEKDRNIYTFCLDSIEINDGGKYVEFKEYYKNNEKALDELLDRMEFKDTYKDGGSKLYANERSDLAILICNTLEGNKDVYIGPKDMTYEEGFCKSRYTAIDSNEFEIIYHVSDIISTTDEDYKYVTLYEPNGIDVVTVKIETVKLENVKRNKNYTFKFTSDKIPFESSIEKVFEYSKLENIVEIKK